MEIATTYDLSNSDGLDIRPTVRGYAMKFCSDGQLRILLGDVPKGYLKSFGGGIDTINGELENSLDALVRECSEETGMVPEQYSVKYQFEEPFVYPSKRKGVDYIASLEVYVLELNESFNLKGVNNHINNHNSENPDDVEFYGMKFYTLDECYDLLKFNEQEDIILDIFNHYENKFNIYNNPNVDNISYVIDSNIAV